jgi:hypothetical protein
MSAFGRGEIMAYYGYGPTRLEFRTKAALRRSFLLSLACVGVATTAWSLGCAREDSPAVCLFSALLFGIPTGLSIAFVFAFFVRTFSRD